MELRAGVVVDGPRPSWRNALLIALDDAGFSLTFNVVVTDLASVPFGAGGTDIVLVTSESSHISIADIRSALPLDSRVPVVVISSGAGEDDVIGLLEAGADDVLVWPVSAQLLAATARAVIRRVSHAASAPGLIRVRDLTVDLRSHEVAVKDQSVELTPSEFRMLSCLVQNPGQVVSSKTLLREAQGYECEDSEAQGIVKVHIRRLRNKIEPVPSKPTYIVNVRGFGYRLERRAIVHVDRTEASAT